MPKQKRKEVYDFERFHVVIKGKRTTFSLDKYLADLLAVHLEKQPDTAEAITAIRLYLSDAMDKRRRAFTPKLPISRQMREIAIDAIARPSLVKKYWELQ